MMILSQDGMSLVDVSGYPVFDVAFEDGEENAGYPWLLVAMFATTDTQVLGRYADMEDAKKRLKMIFAAAGTGANVSLEEVMS